MSSQCLDYHYLVCTEGTSDKVYELFLEHHIDGCGPDEYIVRANYGRRGSVLKPVEKYRGNGRANAEIMFGDVYEEKIAKGYHTNPNRLVHYHTWDNFYANTELDRKTTIKKKEKVMKSNDKPTNPTPPQVDRNITLGEL